MISVISNLFALIPINYAFVVQKDILRGNLYTLLTLTSVCRHSLCQNMTPRIDLWSKRIDLVVVWSVCGYNAMSNLVLVIPYACMIALYVFYLSPRAGRYQVKHYVAHALGLHLVGALVALKV